MIIRRMQEGDVALVHAIEEAVFSLPWSEKSFSDAIKREDNIYIVAEEDGEILGYAGAWGVFGEADITNMCVSPMHRRKGVGAALMKRLILEGRGAGIGIFFLEVRESNEAAINLYKSNGFMQVGVRKNFYEKPVENGLVMSVTFS